MSSVGITALEMRELICTVNITVAISSQVSVVPSRDDEEVAQKDPKIQPRR